MRTERLISQERQRVRRWKRILKIKKTQRSRKRHRHYAWGAVSELLSSVSSSIIGNDRSIYDSNKNTWTIVFPEKLCFISNPAETIDVLYSLVQISKKIQRKATIHVNQANCKKMDLAASAAFDILALEVRNQTKCNFSGRYPVDKDVKNLVQCMGLTKHLNIPWEAASTEVQDKFLMMPLFSGKKKTRKIYGGSDQERAATALTEYFNQCIGRAGYTLSSDIKRSLLQWAGEIITNCEEHSGRNEWFAIGYMTPCAGSDGNRFIGECHVAIFNFGRSMAESLISTSTPQHIYRELLDLANKHSQRNFFGASQKYSVSDLCTLYALQDGISRFADPSGENSRGTGTVQIIEAFQHLGFSTDENRQTEMALVSGQTRILFNQKYKMRKMPVYNGVRNVIAFNNSNDLEERPDSANVHSLEGKFPGTLLSFSFFVDAEHLQKLNDPITGTITNLS